MQLQKGLMSKYDDFMDLDCKIIIYLFLFVGKGWMRIVHRCHGPCHTCLDNHSHG